MNTGKATDRPWRIEEHRRMRGGGIAYISIRGPNDEAICDLFPLAGKGGVGIEAARENARLIVAARNQSADDA